MRREDVEAWSETVGQIVKDYVERKVAPLERQIGELQAKLAQVEHRKTIDRGAWSHRESYEKGDLVTYYGSRWECSLNTHGVRPGEGAAWRRRA